MCIKKKVVDDHIQNALQFLHLMQGADHLPKGQLSPQAAGIGLASYEQVGHSTQTSS